MNKFYFSIASDLYRSITDGTHDSPKTTAFGKKLITSKHIKRKEIDFETANFISIEDFEFINKRSKVNQWDVIISMIGEYCGFCYIERNEVIDYAVKNVGLFKTGSELEAKWLYYYLNSPIGKLYLSKCRSGSSQPYLTLGGLRNLQVLNCDYSLKKKIVGILSALDDKIELNNRINSELEAMTKTMYEYWFVQFDFTDENGLPYKSSGGKMMYSNMLKREIPENWEVKKIGEVATVRAGGDKPKMYSQEKTEICSIPIYSNGVDNDGLYGFTNKATINSQSITLSARGTIGFSVLRNKPFVPIIRLIVITPHIADSAKYFDLYIKTMEFEKSGSVQQQLTVPQVSSLNILYPPANILKIFENATTPLVKKIETLKEQNQELSNLRDWLLPMLMNGQVTVGEAYEQVEETLSMAAELETKFG